MAIRSFDPSAETKNESQTVSSQLAVAIFTCEKLWNQFRAN